MRNMTKETGRNYAYYIQFRDKSIKTSNKDNKNVPVYVKIIFQNYITYVKKIR